MNLVFSIRSKEKRNTLKPRKKVVKDNLSTRSEQQVNQAIKHRRNIKSKFDTIEKEENIKEIGSLKSLPKNRFEDTNIETNSKIDNNKPTSKTEKKLEKEKRAKTGFIIICIMIAILILVNAGSVVFFFLAPNKKNCGSGYFLAEDADSNDSCIKCSVKNCDKCLGDSLSDFCFSCKNNFIPEYENGIVKSCNYNDINDEDCLEFDENGLCQKCREGKFPCFYNEKKQICEPCTIEHCTSCFGSSTEVICTGCEKGYYIHSDENKTLACSKCSDHCEICIGNENISYCVSCEDTYNLNNRACSQ